MYVLVNYVVLPGMHEVYKGWRRKNKICRTDKGMCVDPGRPQETRQLDRSHPIRSVVCNSSCHTFPTRKA